MAQPFAFGHETMAIRHFYSFSPPQRAAGAKRRHPFNNNFIITLQYTNPENGEIE